jgi:hypothetical protein
MPRKSGERYTCGKLKPQEDPGTEELRRQREGLARGKVSYKDPRLEYALGLLNILELITDEQLSAGLQYGRLHLLAWGPWSEQSNMGKLVHVDNSIPRLMPTEADVRNHRAYVAARKAAGEHFQVVEDCAVFGVDVAQGRLQELRAGLQALYEHFVHERKRKKIDAVHQPDDV